jgi:uncharacterized membrane protein YeaQ/YmgE (transglycosylase-associated protein family)
MTELELSPAAQQVVNVVLIWIGFGTLAGLLAVVILPVRHPSGPIATLLLGIVGSVLGLFALTWFFRGRPLNPISPLGFLAATAGAFVLHILFRGCQACLPKGKPDDKIGKP